MRPFRVSALVLSLASGCSAIFSPGRPVILGITEVRAPATVQRDAAFNVTFIVQTGGCVNFRRMQLTQTSSSATVTAHGWDGSGRGIACTADIRYEPQEVAMKPPFSDPFVVRAQQPNGSEITAQVRVQ
ncbi:MAG: hypothetical protein ABIV11_06600 [Gemmatimonadaceae bacterium]